MSHSDEMIKIYEAISKLDEDLLTDGVINPAMAYRQILRYLESAARDIPPASAGAEDLKRAVILVKQLMIDSKPV